MEKQQKFANDLEKQKSTKYMKKKRNRRENKKIDGIAFLRFYDENQSKYQQFIHVRMEEKIRRKIKTWIYYYAITTQHYFQCCHNQFTRFVIKNLEGAQNFLQNEGQILSGCCAISINRVCGFMEFMQKNLDSRLSRVKLKRGKQIHGKTIQLNFNMVWPFLWVEFAVFGTLINYMMSIIKFQQEEV